jgi:protein-tyrosine phosphatase
VLPSGSDPLRIDWLTDALAISGCFPHAAAERLAREHYISHVVDLRAEACDPRPLLARHGITLLHLPTPDKCPLAPERLARGVDWVLGALGRGARVLVHCQYGIGRSALLCLCVLVRQGMDPLDALTLVKAARAIVSPSPDQLQAFITFCDGAASFDALARIAYAHHASNGSAG